MKKIYLFLFLLVNCLLCHAQLFGLEHDSVNPYVTALPYPMDGNYRVVSFDHRFPALPVNRARIKVYDSAQHYVKTINLLKGITAVNDHPPLLYNKKLLWPANYRDTVTNAQNALVILELDTNYNFVALHTVTTHSNNTMPTGLVAYSTGFVVGEYINNAPGSGTAYSTKVFKLGLNLLKKDSALFSDELRLKTHTSKNNKIVGASDNLSPACTATNQLTQKIVLDTNLTITDCLNIHLATVYFCYDAGGNMTLQKPELLKPKGIIFPLSNSKNYVHGEWDAYTCSPPAETKRICNAVFDGNTLSHYYLNDNAPDNTEFPLYQAADCDYYGSTVISVGTVGLKNGYSVDKNFYRPYYAKLKTKLSVTKLDTSGNLIWRNEFGGEMNYFARSVAFTRDGGCVIAGTRYDSATFYAQQVFENFLMKLDANGNLLNVGIRENLLSESGKINCFPNPVTNDLHFDIPVENNISIQICNNIGQQILQNKNYTNLSSINMEGLEKGVYFYRIVTAKNVYSGKILKE